MILFLGYPDDFIDRGAAGQYLRDAVLAQRFHAVILRRAFYLRAGYFREDHVTYLVGKRKELEYAQPPFVTGVLAYLAALALVELHVRVLEFDTKFLKDFRRRRVRLFA